MQVYRKSYLLLAAAFLIVIAAFAQDTSKSAIIDVAKIPVTKNITSFCRFYADNKNYLTIEEVAKTQFSSKLEDEFYKKNKLPNKYISSSLYLKFTLTNSSNAAHNLYLNPGYYFRVFEIYKVNNGTPVPNPGFVNVENNVQAQNYGYKLIEVLPGETTEYLVKLKFVKTTVNHILPQLIRDESILQQIVFEKSNFDLLNIITYIISGFFLMMIFYSFASYRQAYRPEFLFYGGYTLCVSILLFLKAVLHHNTSWFNFLFEGYADFLVQLTSVYLYLLFIRSYLNTKENYPFIEKVLAGSKWVVIGAAAIYTYVFFGTDNFLLQNSIELYTKYYLVLLGLIFIIAGLQYKDRLLKYVVYGNICLIFFGLISLLLIATPYRMKGVPWIFNNSLMYYDLSVLFECLLFMMGLSYKNKKELIEKVKMQEAFKREQERQKMEKQLTIIHTQQEERNRISADMHDELGAGMTAIRLMSEMAKAKTKDHPIPEIDKISDSANDLLNKMNAIIWSMISSNDSLPNLVSYIRSYALTYFENIDIKCKIDVHNEVPERELSGEKRRNIFLTVKEALNNVIKHSHASELAIDFSFEKNICISIKDNGVGINKEKIREFGNGLTNMRKRMERIGGKFEIENTQGTTLKLCIPFDKSIG